MKVAYFDCFAGAAGDMIVGALLDAGLDIDELISELNKLNLKGWQVQANKIKKQGIEGTKFNVQLENQHHNHGHHHHRNLYDITNIINNSLLDQSVKDTALRIFSRLAEAEAKVHGTTIEEIHFHEVGALDAIIDIVGAAIAFYKLGIEKVICSPLTTGTGFVECAHGTIPVPAPATVELLQGVPYQHGDIKQEILTPTGAAILTTMSSKYTTMPEIICSSVGYGGGDRELPVPNLLRVHIGELTNSEEENDTAQVIEANIDDMNPELYPAVTERLLESGALDIYINQVLMKKGRPGTVIHLLVPQGMEQQVGQVLLEETTSIGYRSYPVKRTKMEREIVPVETRFGIINVKIARNNQKILNYAPEYEDCRRVADAYKVPIKLVYNTAIEEFGKI
ncbi:MAG: nickel pincer cofactor biosynthesis protein LarC [Firmicutes bacterium]|nr:nickel pincer cofactor biosynthesis protein LarC [Bacillota bacterium]